MITCQAGLVPGNSGGLPGLRADAEWRFSLCGGGRRRCRRMADRAGEDRKPVSRSPGHGVAPSARPFPPGPVGIADADTGCMCREGPGAGPSRPGPGGYPREASWSWPGPEPVTTPAARPAWSQRAERWRVNDVGCLPQRAGYPLSRPHPLQLLGQLGDQLAQWRQVKHSRLAAGVCHPPGPGRLGCAACLVSQAAGDQAAQPRPLSHRDVPASAGADRRISGSTRLRIRGSTRLRITGSISLPILRHHNHLTSRPWTAWPA